MGGGLTQVGILAVLTVIVLPCCFFTLLALLDRFERSLAIDETASAAEAKSSVAAAADFVIAALVDVVSAPEPLGADVVTLPVAVTASPITSSAATG
jgi:hypothetical protein